MSPEKGIYRSYQQTNEQIGYDGFFSGFRGLLGKYCERNRYDGYDTWKGWSPAIRQCDPDLVHYFSCELDEVAYLTWQTAGVRVGLARSFCWMVRGRARDI